MIKLIVQKNDSNQTLINFIKKSFKHESLAKIYHLFYKKKIKVNDKRITNFKYIVQENDIVVIYDQQLKIQEKERIINPNIKIDIAYQDKQILIVVKEHGIVIHSPLSNSLDNIVRYYLKENEPELFDSPTFTISHQYRLDKLTKGLVIYCKNKSSQQILNKAQEKNNIIKKYLAICHGKITKQINITGFIFKDEENQKMIFSKKQVSKSKNCLTIIKPIKIVNDFSLIECQLVTGRKHQIRATLSYLKMPIVGDKKYGSLISFENKIMLFAYYLNFKNLEGDLQYLNNKQITLKSIQNDLSKWLKNIEIKKI